MRQKIAKPVNSIVILGGGTAGWMTACALGKLLPSNQYKITLIESEQIGTVGVGEATLPHLKFFNQRLGIDETEFMQATKATFKLGIEFSHWGALNDAYIHPFGDYGKKQGGIDFHHYWLKQQQSGIGTSIDNYSLPVMASKAQKFEFPHADPNHVKSTYSYAYHIDAGRYAAYLRKLSEACGVKRIEGKVVEVMQRSDNQHIEILALDDGTRVEGDFFVDCSGFRGRLIEQVLKSGYQDWSHWLPCNRAVAVASKNNASPLPYTKAIAQEAGWQWQIPLQHRTGNGQVYCDDFVDTDHVLNSLLQNLPGEPLTEPNHLRFKTGKRNKSWSHNCVAIGLSSGFLEPLESTSIYLIQAAIMKLVELFPSANTMQIKAAEFNTSLDQELEKIRDFLILHYHATCRDDSDFWHYCKNMQIPDSLKHKMAMFKRHGHIQEYQHGLFLRPSWLAVYVGQRIIPERYDPRLNGLSDSELAGFLGAIEDEIKHAVNDMGSHQQFLNKIAKMDVIPAGVQIPLGASK